MAGMSGSDTEFTSVGADHARNLIAAGVLGAETLATESVESAVMGTVHLKPMQQDAVRRLRETISEFGGAMLCDPVGTGKTFVALAVARRARRILVVAPAVLRETWLAAALAADRPVVFRSIESLGRNSDTAGQHDVLIVDEAHHARNTATRRFRRLAALASRGDVILLTATPIHNRRRELLNLLSLFLGERAYGLTNAELARCVLRRESATVSVPAVEKLQWVGIRSDDSLPALLMALPPPLPVRGGGNGGVLIALSLVRQWASSDAALTGGLKRRLQRAVALIAALEQGTYPSDAELQTWCAPDGAVQLAFAGLLAPPSFKVNELLPVVRRHANAIERILHLVAAESCRDDERAEQLLEIRRRHEQLSVVAFSQYADTVRAMFDRLARHGAIAALTANGGRVAGGRITREETLARFAPIASGRSKPRPADAVSLLLTTDLLSEGVNLQDAGVVVHLDLPWTPARMEQRVGRLARIGSLHGSVHTYAVRPPASAEMVARLETILEEKMRRSGVVVDTFPSLTAFPHSQAADNEPRVIEAIRELLSGWSVRPNAERNCSRPSVAAVCARDPGFLALCRHDGRSCLLAGRGNRIGDDTRLILRCIGLATGEQIELPAEQATGHLRAALDHLRVARALGRSHAQRPGHGSVRTRLLKRIDIASLRTRPHARGRVMPLVAKARHAITGRWRIHLETELAALDEANPFDESFLNAIVEITSRCDDASGPESSGHPEVIAMIVFCAGDHANALSCARKR